MANAWYHALGSVRKWGGLPEDYTVIHEWMDASKLILADMRHRALRHHAEGAYLAVQVFGQTLTNSSGRVVPVRLIVEQHILDDLGHIPSFADWARAITPQRWMVRRSEQAMARLAGAEGGMQTVLDTHAGAEPAECAL